MSGLAAIFCLTTGGSSGVSQAAPVYPVMLEFLNAPAGGQPLQEVPRLTVTVAGVGRSAVVDTGSTGVILSATSIPDIDRLPSLGSGQITYSSSGRIMTGRWVVTPLTIAGRHGQVTTKPLPVLAVDAVDAVACTPAARRCAPVQHPTGVAMLGIGFGREHDRQPGGTPDHNPLLKFSGDGPHAYVVTRYGITLGGDRRGFAVVRLARDEPHGDWAAPPACITLGNGRPSCGTVLIDTGITGMFLTVPPDRLPGGNGTPTLPAGTRVAITLAPATEGAPAAGYQFLTAEASAAVAPTSVTLAGTGKRPTSVNTGVHLLNRFAYLYDADTGVVGYRREEP